LGEQKGGNLGVRGEKKRRDLGRRPLFHLQRIRTPLDGGGLPREDIALVTLQKKIPGGKKTCVSNENEGKEVRKRGGLS